MLLLYYDSSPYSIESHWKAIIAIRGAVSAAHIKFLVWARGEDSDALAFVYFVTVSYTHCISRLDGYIWQTRHYGNMPDILLHFWK